MTQSVPAPLRNSSPRCDVLIVVPPFFELHYPSLGAHVLQACGRAAGFRVRVLYANLLCASFIGLRRYRTFSQAPLGTFVGERLFARSAYGTAPLGRRGQMLTLERIHGTALAPAIYDDDRQFGGAYHFDLLDTEALIPAWVEAMGRYIASLGVPVIGATTTFQQTAPAIALLRAARRYTTDAITIIGGANCEGEMAEGIRSLAPFIDYVFSGESEASVPAVSRGPSNAASALPIRSSRAVRARTWTRCRHWSTTTTSSSGRGPSRRRTAPRSDRPPSSYETSRGCWWGQKQHCTFCGLNGEGMGFRTRSAERVIAEIRTLAGKYHPASIIMADNIMPYEYFSTVLPRLAKELPGLKIFYEQKANLSRERLVLLRDAGIHSIQPGIEALSTDLLRLMRKGTTARQNVGLLRDARGVADLPHVESALGIPRRSALVVRGDARDASVAPSPSAALRIHPARIRPLQPVLRRGRALRDSQPATLPRV